LPILLLLRRAILCLLNARKRQIISASGISEEKLVREGVADRLVFGVKEAAYLWRVRGKMKGGVIGRPI
jgi:hypothetical protein